MMNIFGEIIKQADTWTLLISDIGLTQIYQEREPLSWEKINAGGTCSSSIFSKFKKCKS